MEEKALVEKKLRIQERGGVVDEERLGESRRDGVQEESESQGGILEWMFCMP